MKLRMKRSMYVKVLLNSSSLGKVDSELVGQRVLQLHDALVEHIERLLKRSISS